jgi:glycosyltransferase involved in cell wall biosynthesis
MKEPKVKINKKKNFNEEPKFSILMANYNNGKYITEAIQSVLNQTFKDWELVIVDDCSTDDSVAKIMPFLTDKRVRLLKNETNLGYIDTLKKLVYESVADIFGILDSDDVLIKDALSIMYEKHFEHPDCGLIYSQFIFCDEQLKLLENGFCDSIPSGETSLHYNCVSAFRTFKKKDYFKTTGFDNEILYAEDKDIILKMEEVSKLLFVDQILYYHRVLPYSQNHHPIKRKIGRISFCLAKYKAFKRRFNTDIPNLTLNEMSTELYRASSLCTKIRDFKRSIYFLSNAVRLDPLNFKGIKIYAKEIIRLE